MGLESWWGFYQSTCPTQMGLSLNIGTSHGVQHPLLQFGFNCSCLLNVCEWLLICFVLLWGVTHYHILLFHISIWKEIGIIHFHVMWVFSDMLITTFIKLKLVLDFVQTLFNKHLLGSLSNYDQNKVCFWCGSLLKFSCYDLYTMVTLDIWLS